LTEGVVRLDRAVDPEDADPARLLRLAYLNAHFQTGLANALDEAIQSGRSPDLTGVTKVDEIPYDFIRKRLSIIVDEQEGGQTVRRLIVKGAFEPMLAICTQLWRSPGAVALGPSEREALLQNYAAWSAQGFRVLGVAERTVASQPVYDRDDERDLVFAGFLLFFDPPKSGVAETIAGLAGLGVELKIITGDNRLVAAHTAETLHLPVHGVLTGSELAKLSDEALWHAAERTTIFAEVDPNTKERIILALQKTGHVVGYMGDGINDAPSLHAADVGISVNTAVDVAKEAADFVLLDKDLSVLQQGIVQGRRTFANTLKYVFMATSANFGNMFSMAGASIFLSFLPMLPKQILLINFLTDLPEMTIAGDAVDDYYIRRPHRWEIAFIRRFMFTFGAVSSIFDYLTFGVLLWVLHANQTLFHTGWFVESVVSAVAVVFAMRTRRPFFRSRPSTPLMLTAAAVVAVTLWLPYSPLAGLLGFAPLPLPYLAIILVIVVLYFAAAEVTKHYFYRRAAPVVSQ
jgi:Mg2+-importing ATPase